MKLRAVIIILILALSLIPPFYLDRALKRKLEPKRSALRFGLYMVIALSFVFFYTFLIAFLIIHLFPVANK